MCIRFHRVVPLRQKSHTFSAAAPMAAELGFNNTRTLETKWCHPDTTHTNRTDRERPQDSSEDVQRIRPDINNVKGRATLIYRIYQTRNSSVFPSENSVGENNAGAGAFLIAIGQFYWASTATGLPPHAPIRADEQKKRVLEETANHVNNMLSSNEKLLISPSLPSLHNVQQLFHFFKMRQPLEQI